MIDTKSKRAGKMISTVELTGKKITKIVDRGPAYGTKMLKFEHENGVQTIYDKGSASNSEREQRVPYGHVIIGVYGMCIPGDGAI